MKNGDMPVYPIFTQRRFWPQFFWLLIMCVGGALSCVFSSAPLFIASVLVAFLGLNESSRWSHKTNMLICVVGTVAGSVCGIFTWFEIVSVFILLFAIGGFMLYYRESAQKIIPIMEDLVCDVAKEQNMAGAVSIAIEKIRGMTAGDEVFIVVTDNCGGLYMPECADKPRVELSRNGGAVWKVFASGRPYLTGCVEPSKDMPLYREARSIMSVVLNARNEKLGVLQVESKNTEAFSEDDLCRLDTIAFIISQLLYGFINDSH